MIIKSKIVRKINEESESFKEANITAVKRGDVIKFYTLGNEFNDYGLVEIGESDADEQFSPIKYDLEAFSQTSYRKINIEIKMVCRRLKNKFFK